jgi:hypothetical protein
MARTLAYELVPLTESPPFGPQGLTAVVLLIDYLKYIQHRRGDNIAPLLDFLVDMEWSGVCALPRDWTRQ